MKNPRLSALCVVLLGLAGCNWDIAQLFGMGQYEVVVLDKPTMLGPEPLRLVGDAPLQVRGVTTDLCFGLADNVAQDSDLDAQLASSMGGAKLSAVLHGDDGKDYHWKCNGWQLSGHKGQFGRLSTCMRWDCNGGPAKGSAITSIDVISDKPLQVLDARWSSTAAFDYVSQPPSDTHIVDSAEYRELEAEFGGKPAWASKASTALQIRLSSNRRHPGSSEFNSSLSVRLEDDGIQIQPVVDNAGLAVLTIPGDAVEACTMSSFGGLAQYAELVLPDTGILVGFLNAPEVIDWCWNHKIPMATNKARRKWLSGATPLPPKEGYAEQLQSREDYDAQAKRAAAGY